MFLSLKLGVTFYIKNYFPNVACVNDVNSPSCYTVFLSYIFRPEVEFNIRLLKAVQLMEFPLLKSWVANLVNDCLKLCKCCEKFIRDWIFSLWKILKHKELSNVSQSIFLMHFSFGGSGQNHDSIM